MPYHLLGVVILVGMLPAATLAQTGPGSQPFCSSDSDCSTFGGNCVGGRCRWTSAAELKTGMEAIVSYQVMEMQKQYKQYLTAGVSTPCVGSAGSVCDATADAFQPSNPFLVYQAQV